MAAPTSDAIFVPVLPSLRGFTEELDKGTTTAAKAAGQNAGKAFADGLSSAKAAVDKASSSLAMARNKEADALDKISVAQAKLATLTEKGVTDAGRLAAAKRMSQRLNETTPPPPTVHRRRLQTLLLPRNARPLRRKLFRLKHLRQAKVSRISARAPRARNRN